MECELFHTFMGFVWFARGIFLVLVNFSRRPTWTMTSNVPIIYSLERMIDVHNCSASSDNLDSVKIVYGLQHNINNLQIKNITKKKTNQYKEPHLHPQINILNHSHTDTRHTHTQQQKRSHIVTNVIQTDAHSKSPLLHLSLYSRIRQRLIHETIKSFIGKFLALLTRF